MILGILYSQIQYLFEQDPNTGYWHVSYEVMDWLGDNDIPVKEQEFKTNDDSRQFGLLFETAEDVIAFILRWM